MRISTIATFVGLCIVLGKSAVADEKSKDQFAALSPFVNDQTVAVVSINLAELDIAAWQTKVVTPLCNSDAERAAVTAGFDQVRHRIDEVLSGGDGQVYAVCMLPLGPLPADQLPVPDLMQSTFFVVPGAARGQVFEELKSWVQHDRRSSNLRKNLVCRVMNNAAVIAPLELMESIESIQAAERPELQQAFATAGNVPIRAAIIPPPLFVRAATEILRDPLPGTEKPLGPFLARALCWAAVGVDIKVDHVRAQLTVQSADAEAAGNLATFLLQTSAPVQAFLSEFAKQVPAKEATLPKWPEPSVTGDRLTWTFDEEYTAATRQVVAKAIVAGRADAQRNQSRNHLKAIALTILNYEATHHELPDRAIRDKDGKPLLSWRVAILPVLEENSHYQEFHLDEPWDSDHNRKLIERMPDMFRNPDIGPQQLGYTRYLAPVGESLMFPPDRAIALKEVTDGLQNTIMVVESDPDHAVIWTKPDDIEIDLNDPARGLATKNKLFLATFADGHVQGFSGSIDPKILKALFTRNGGEPVNSNGLHTDH